ncbi:MAG TPA: SLC13 family permease [Capillibacterium sp.]
MGKGLRKMVLLLKTETVLCIAGAVAILSMFWVPPSRAYLDYIDFSVLALLFCLMTVVAGFQRSGFFFLVAQKILARIDNMRALARVLVFLCFFSSMWITNDVALITFVPLAIMLFGMTGQRDLLIPVVVLQTIAANLGSMLTPVGNPQNLYLYSYFRLTLQEFLGITLPVTLVSFVLLWLLLFVFKKQAIVNDSTGENRPVLAAAAPPVTEGRRPYLLLLYTVLFLFSLAAVNRWLDYRLAFLIVLGGVLAFDRSILKKVDYALLVTFCFFFIFVGNVSHLPGVKEFLAGAMAGRELWIAVLTSQVLSNVPAAVLLAPFSGDPEALILGTNVGGLGTLIASLASLISYKLYARSARANPGRYLAVFTLFNLSLLAVILCYLAFL